MQWLWNINTDWFELSVSATGICIPEGERNCIANLPIRSRWGSKPQNHCFLGSAIGSFA
ncbi:hypothetical protein [Phormidium sp. CCY1219]|uniref:hypothetical protein n=1 Tax=Phormidium sp. CCY1219 TaxID=2886104 RepID=UPI002D786D76|nr:hypothetical protein [Phormidium sp. CCY1219]